MFIISGKTAFRMEIKQNGLSRHFVARSSVFFAINIVNMVNSQLFDLQSFTIVEYSGSVSVELRRKSP